MRQLNTAATGTETARTRGCARAFLGLALVGLLAPVQGAHAQPLCRTSDAGCEGVEPAAYESARSLGLGAGLRATAISTSALAYSPAALALGNLYQLEGTVDYMPRFDTVALGGAVVDSATSKIGAGLGLRGFLSGDDGYDGLDGRLGLAFPFSDAFAVGLLGRYITLSRDIDIGGEVEEQELAQGFTMDASVRVAPADVLQIDLAVLNFIDIDSPWVPTTVAGSLAIAPVPDLSIGGDVLADITTFDDAGFVAGAAIEYLGGQSIPVRAGYRVDFAYETHALTLGVGYLDQRVGLDLSLRQEIEGGDATRIMAAMRYHVR